MVPATCTLILLLASSLAPAGAAEAGTLTGAVRVAAADITTLPLEDRPYQRYLSLHVVAVKDRPDFLRVLAFHVNSLGRKRPLAPIRTREEFLADRKAAIVLVAADVVRVDIRDYRWDVPVYDKLATTDPHFHFVLNVNEKDLKAAGEAQRLLASLPPGAKWWPSGKNPDGSDYSAGYYAGNKLVLEVEQPVVVVPAATGKVVEKAAHAPWAEPVLLATLVKETQSEAPLLRADWFIIQTGAQKDRAAGYYQFLGLKNRDDFFALTGVNVKEAQKREDEVAAIIQKSGIASRNRQIYRFGAIGGGYWQTRDQLKKQVKNGNAINALNGDYKHQAERHYGFLPNRLFGYYLSDDKGVQQDSAPDEVGPDSTASSNRTVLEPMVSCVRCHTEGLRPLNDYGRRLFQGPNKLVAYDHEKFKRLEQLYLEPLTVDLDRDTDLFAQALVRLNGPEWTTRKNSLAYGRVWKAWADDDVTIEQAAREWDTTPQKLQAAFRHYAAPPSKGGLGRLVPNVLLAFMAEKPLPMLREHFEEVHGLGRTVLLGYVPVDKIDTPKGEKQ